MKWCWLFHKWSKWETITVNSAECTADRQQWTCIVCGKIQRVRL